MKQSKSLRIWHVGNCVSTSGRSTLSRPLKLPSKDVEILNYAQPFVEALRAIPSAEVISQPSWELYHMSPEAFEERLLTGPALLFLPMSKRSV